MLSPQPSALCQGHTKAKSTPNVVDADALYERRSQHRHRPRIGYIGCNSCNSNSSGRSTTATAAATDCRNQHLRRVDVSSDSAIGDVGGGGRGSFCSSGSSGGSGGSDNWRKSGSSCCSNTAPPSLDSPGSHGFSHQCSPTGTPVDTATSVRGRFAFPFVAAEAAGLHRDRYVLSVILSTYAICLGSSVLCLSVPHARPLINLANIDLRLRCISHHSVSLLCLPKQFRSAFGQATTATTTGSDQQHHVLKHSTFPSI